MEFKEHGRFICYITENQHHSITINSMKFNHHNLQMPNGEFTISKDQQLFGESKVWRSIDKTIRRFYQPQNGKTLATSRAVDLGCYEGGFSVELARMGFDTLGIEARETNLEFCNYLKQNLGLPNLNFIRTDVRDLDMFKPFDVTLCYGLLYHLNDPIAFINKLSDCTTNMLLLNTHYATEHDLTYGLGWHVNKYVIAPIQKRIPVLNFRHNYKLSNVCENEGYMGRWYKEWEENVSKEKLEKNVWASYNNSKSFWLCKKQLINALHDAGFHTVFEQFDFTGDVFPENYNEYFKRGMFVCFK